MSDRDELAAMVGESIQEKLLDDCPDYWPDTKEWGESIADAILAAGYRPPARVITTQGELDALPVGSVVALHGADDVCIYTGGGEWKATGAPDLFGITASVLSPVTVLREGNE